MANAPSKAKAAKKSTASKAAQAAPAKAVNQRVIAKRIADTRRRRAAGLMGSSDNTSRWDTRDATRRREESQAAARKGVSTPQVKKGKTNSITATSSRLKVTDEKGNLVPAARTAQGLVPLDERNRVPKEKLPASWGAEKAVFPGSGATDEALPPATNYSPSQLRKIKTAIKTMQTALEKDAKLIEQAKPQMAKYIRSASERLGDFLLHIEDKTGKSFIIAAETILKSVLEMNKEELPARIANDLEKRLSKLEELIDLVKSAQLHIREIDPPEIA